MKFVYGVYVCVYLYTDCLHVCVFVYCAIRTTHLFGEKSMTNSSFEEISRQQCQQTHLA